MTVKSVPFTAADLERIAGRHPTPFHIYDEKAIRETARGLLRAFAWAPDFREYFAVKACPNPYILKLLREEGFGADCSSLPELLLAQKAGITGESIMFSSNDTPANEYRQARALGAVINLDDFTHIPFLEEQAGLPELLCLRYNPGPLREGNAIIGKPEEAKYGFTRAQLFEGYRILRDRGVKRFGLHTMVASNELNPQYFVDTARMLYALVVEQRAEFGVLKAMGASRGFLCRVVLGQALLIALVGYGAGLGLTLPLISVMHSLGTPMTLTWPLVVGGFAAVVAVCLGAAILPLLKLLRLEPALVFRG